MKLWHYTKMGLQQGPVPEDELRQKIRRAEIGPATLVWHEGMADWQPLGNVAELQENPAPPLPAAPDEPVQSHAVPPQQLETLGQAPLPQPPAYQPGDYVAPVVPNYMWQSVLATVLGILTCWLLALPFGIVAIVYGSKVEGMRVQGDIAGAMRASSSAKMWMIGSFLCSMLFGALFLYALLFRMSA